MTGRAPELTRHDGGWLLMHALFFLSLVALVIATVTTVRLAMVRETQLRADRTRALYIAEAGASVAIAAIVADREQGSYEGGIDTGRYRVAVEHSADDWVTIRSSGHVGPVEKRVTVIGQVAEDDQFVVTTWTLEP